METDLLPSKTNISLIHRPSVRFKIYLVNLWITTPFLLSKCLWIISVNNFNENHRQERAKWCTLLDVSTAFKLVLAVIVYVDQSEISINYVYWFFPKSMFYNMWRVMKVVWKMKECLYVPQSRYNSATSLCMPFIK